MCSSTRGQIEELLQAGMRPAAIARHLGLASSTVDYHLARTAESPSRPTETEKPRGAPKRTTHPVSTRARVAAMLDEGVSRAAIAATLGVGKPTVSYHARRLDASMNHKCARRYDWAAVQEYYDRGHSVRDCIREFGFASHSWSSAVKRGAVVPRPQAMSIEELLGKPRNRTHLKQRLIAAGLKKSRCEECGIAEWHGQALSMALHHVNGDRHDNRLENLRLLCPNCHSQTDTFAGRNRPGGTGSTLPRAGTAGPGARE